MNTAKELEIEKESAEKSGILLQSSLESFKDIIVLSVNQNYCYLYFNEFHNATMKNLFNKDIKIGENILDYVTEGEDRNKSKRNYDLALSGESHTIIEDYGEEERTFFESSYNPIYGNENKIIGVTVFARDITERLLQKELLEESEERFKILHNASFGGIAIHDKGIIMDCNQGLSNLTGYTMNELTGMDGLLLIAPSYRDYVMDKIQSGFEKSYESKGIRKSGEIYPLKLEARNIPFKGKTVRVVEFRDITELKKKEFELQENIELFEQLFTNTPVGISIVDSITGKLLNANQPYLDILGLTIDELKTVDWMQITHEDDLTASLFNMKQLNSGAIEEYQMEKRVFRKTGDIRYVELFVRPLNAANSNRKTHFAIMNDITDRINNKTEIEYLSYHDSLTGLYTRVKSNEYINQLINKQSSFGVIMIDLDDFKYLNDNYGHNEGDKILVGFGEILGRVFENDAIVSRFGGDEFLIIKKNFKLEEFDSYKKDIYNELEKETDRNKLYKNFKFSIGCSIYEDGYIKTGEELIIEADNRMYSDKSKNKNSKRRSSDRL